MCVLTTGLRRNDLVGCSIYAQENDMACKSASTDDQIETATNTIQSHWALTVSGNAFEGLCTLLHSCGIYVTGAMNKTPEGSGSGIYQSHHMTSDEEFHILLNNSLSSSQGKLCRGVGRIRTETDERLQTSQKQSFICKAHQMAFGLQHMTFPLSRSLWLLHPHRSPWCSGQGTTRP